MKKHGPTTPRVIPATMELYCNDELEAKIVFHGPPEAEGKKQVK